MKDQPGQPKLIDRRNVLKYGGLLTATAAGREFLARWLPKGSTALASEEMPGMNMPSPGDQEVAANDASEPYTPRFFKPEEFRTVEILTEMIIPTDDKPGAKEARVAQYIDYVVYAAAEFDPKLQEQWTTGLAELGQLGQEKFSRSFLDLSASEREELLIGMSRPEYEKIPTSAPKYKSMRLEAGISRSEASTHLGHPGFAFYRLAKEMTLEGFYSSQIGLTDVLEYKGLSVHANFPGCTHPEHQA
ncbi:MAG: gluconate 2-dehydrogenase subunit 3 family protein [Terriglobia bacterium]